MLVVKKLLAKILGALLIDSTTPTVANFITLNSGYSIQNLAIRRYGKLLAVNFRLKYTSSMTANTTYIIGTLNLGYRPVVNSGGASATFRELIDTDGRIYLRPATNVNANSWEAFSIMYLLNN